MERPCNIWPQQSGPPRPEEKQAHNEIADEMPGFADKEMPRLKMCCVHPEKEMENGEENAAGIVGTANLAGFSNDDSQPESGGDPNF